MEMWNRHGKQNFRLTIGSEDWIMLSDPDDVGVRLELFTYFLFLHLIICFDEFISFTYNYSKSLFLKTYSKFLQ